MKKRILGMLLTLSMMLSLVACSNSTDNNDDTNISSAGEKEAKDWESYTIGHNLFLSSGYAFQVVADEAEHALSLSDCKLEKVDNEGSADKVLSDLQTQIVSGIDGVEIISVIDTAFEPLSEICADAGTPFVLYDKIPSDQDVFDRIKENPMFLGAITANEYDAGYQMGEKALEDGCKKALLIRAMVGDYSHDEREKGFREAFEADGGEVVGVAHCDWAEVAESTSNLLNAHPEADCIYGLSAGFLTSADSSIKERKKTADLKLYGSDIDPEVAQRVLDGEIDGLNGGQWVLAAVANSLIINYLDGHQILDENGNPPTIVDALPMIQITTENAKAYLDMVEAGEGSPVPDEKYKSLLYRNNSEASYETLLEVINTYAEDWKSIEK